MGQEMYKLKGKEVAPGLGWIFYANRVGKYIEEHGEPAKGTEELRQAENKVINAFTYHTGVGGLILGTAILYPLLKGLEYLVK